MGTFFSGPAQVPGKSEISGEKKCKFSGISRNSQDFGVFSGFRGFFENSGFFSKISCFFRKIRVFFRISRGSKALRRPSEGPQNVEISRNTSFFKGI